MNRSLGDILVEILAETGVSPGLMSRNMKAAASPHLKTEQDCWVWFCDVRIIANVQGGGIGITGKGATPDEAAASCYRQILAADRSLWKEKT